MAYTKDGIIFPRCTAIIGECNPKNWGPQWGANCVVQWIKENISCSSDDMCDEFYSCTPSDLDKARFEFRNVSQIALDIGSEVHNAVEKHLQGKEYALTSKQAENGFQAFLEWEKEVDLKPSALEFTVWGDRWAGTLDMVCKLNGKIYVVDFKTSKRFYLSEMGAQIAAYRSAIKLTVDGCGILRLDKETGIPEWKDFSKRYLSDLAVFNAMVDLYYLRHPRIRKRFKA